MRNWSHVPPIELFSSSFDHEFSIPRLNAVRRRTLNFELIAEPRLEVKDPPEVGVFK
jgi:hypothetical protein